MSAAVERNLGLYTWYRVSADSFAWMPVFFLYFSTRVSLQDVLWLEAVYLATIVVLEVPSGYLSDRVGRRRTLLLSAASLAAAYLLFLAAGGFHTLALAQLLLGFGMTLRSGSDTALHYDSLLALGRSHEFALREARAERAGLLSLALSVLAGGALGLLDLRLAYALSLLATLASLLVVWRFAEPAAHADWGRAETSFGRQMLRCLGYLRQRAVLWLFGFYLALDVLMHVPYEFYQPYLRLLEGGALQAGATPLASGALLSVTMLLGAAVTSAGVALGARFGLTALLLGALALQVLVIGALAGWLHLAVAALVVLRNVPDAVTHAPFNAALGRHLESAHRATFLSLLNLIARLAMVLLLAGLATRVGPAGTADWSTLSDLLAICAALGAGALAVLAVFAGGPGGASRARP